MRPAKQKVSVLHGKGTENSAVVSPEKKPVAARKSKNFTEKDIAGLAEALDCNVETLFTTSDGEQV